MDQLDAGIDRGVIVEKIKWEPDNFELQTTSIWDFPNRGSWATHDSSYRGNWSPYIPRNVILRYSCEGDLLLDQFTGGGTTLIEAKILNRDAIGVDINPNSLKIAAEKCRFSFKHAGKVYFRVGDARKLSFIPDQSIDLICTHPPYANIIQYSPDIDGDISRMPVELFLAAMRNVADESYRVLRTGKFCVILMGDIRRNGLVLPLGFQVMEKFLQSGFQLKDIAIKKQHNCQETGKWTQRSKQYNFLLLAHEYLFIFKK
jgi:DNA modification methylase